MTPSERITAALAVGIANAGLIGAISLGIGAPNVWPGMLIVFGSTTALILTFPRRK